jgi:hypothetical protein
MKKLIVLISGIFLLGSFYNSVSGASSNIGKSVVYQQNNKKTKIKATDLPQEVQKALNREYNGWTLTSNLYKVKSASGSYYYQVELQKDFQTMIINVDENGKKLSDVDMS